EATHLRDMHPVCHSVGIWTAAELSGFNNSLTKSQFSTMPSLQAGTNTAAIAEQAMPYFRAKAAEKAAIE
ncbi:MAG TPA: hypothetical protein VKA18_03675, partial [Alphaproteobacteria bacterium]|nr:hypothetical protein [Alphaproteobacteria bacterium]